MFSNDLCIALTLLCTLFLTKTELRVTTEFAADVLICVAGLGGLTLAIDLARRGASFRLIDRVDSPFFRGSHGTDIRPRTQEIVEDLGIAAGASVCPSGNIAPMAASPVQMLWMTKDPRPAEPYRFLLKVPQFLTESVMRERLVEFAHQPEFRCDLVRLDQDEDSVIARLSSKARPRSFECVTCWR
jgi:2-polyprenyl-6-methoxyphenol hydroxylase-like FAD-dependent oxidoreductase